MGDKIRKGIVSAALFVIALLPSAAQEKSEQTDSLVRLMKGKSIELIELDGRSYRKAVESTFLHNGTYLISDTALWDVDAKVINAWGHVQVIQDETILTSENLDYYVDENLARFRGTLVQLENKRRNTLRTRNLDYNTKDSTATFTMGAAMRDEDGQLIESIEGSYDSKREEFKFWTKVNMFTDSVFVRTVALKYESATNRASFLTPIDFWRDGYMLSANGGWYDRGRELFFFTDKVHAMSETQEAWSDSLYFWRGPNDVTMMGNAQVKDTTRNVTAMAGVIEYRDSISKLTLRRDAAVALRTEEEKGKADTLYFGADSLIYRTYYKCDLPENIMKEAEDRLKDMFVDPVLEYRRKAAAAAAEAAQKAKDAAMEKLAKVARKQDGNAPGDSRKGPKEEGKPEAGDVAAGETVPSTAEAAAQTAEPADSLVEIAASIDSPTDSLALDTQLDSLGVEVPSDALAASRDSLVTPQDSLVSPSDSLAASSDSLAVPRDSLAASADSLASPADSLGAQTDSLAVQEPKDSTKVGFAWGLGNVRVFRKDMQVRCDSLAFCDLDSLARFYKEPVVWNDRNRQYSSDSLFVLVKNQRMDRASLLSNAFIITQEDSLCFDQIKGAEVMAYFDSTTALRRFDALGGANAMFYLKENDALATVNKVECKMMSATLKGGEVERVFYFEQPHNDAYPVVQLPDLERKMKGFNWTPERRPSGPKDITSYVIRDSERSSYKRRPHATFEQAALYFPGYLDRIYREIQIRDSLSRIPRPVGTPADTASVTDSLRLPSVVSDSVKVVSDSLGTFPVADADSTAGAPAADSVAVGEPEAHTPEQIRAEKQAKREELRKLRIARRDARWAELDARDAAKAEAKKQKALDRQREKTKRALLKQRKQEAADAVKLEKYIEFYKKQKAREDARKQESESSRERTSGTEGGGEVPPSDESGAETAGGDGVLRHDGTVDDNPVLSGGSLPWA